MSTPVLDPDRASPGELRGSREARPLPLWRLSAPPDVIQPVVAGFPGEARSRPDWARKGKTQPISGYPGEAASWPILAHPDDVVARPVRPRHAEPRPPSTRTSRSGRTVRLMTLERDGPPSPRAPRRSRSAPSAGSGRRSKSAAPCDVSQGPGLQDWMATMLQDRSSLQLDTTNICMVLHALWKKPARREPMLKDAEFRQRAFNAFVMDVLKAYQMWEKSDDGDVPMDSINKRKKRKQDNYLADEPEAGVDTTDPSDPLWEPTAGDSDEHEQYGAAADDDPDWRETSPDPTPKAVRKNTVRLKTGTPRARRSKVAKAKAVSPRKSSSQPSPRTSRPPPETSDASTEATRTKENTRKRRPRCWQINKDKPVAEAVSEDLCARVNGPMMRTSGRKIWRNDAVLSLARKDEDASAVPDSSFFFIRCARCPELVFVDYPAIRQHWEQKCHFLACVLCDMIFNTGRLALAHLRVIHKDPVPEGWFRLVRCHPCGRSGFYSTEQVISHMAGHRAERARNPALFPPFLTCYKRIRCNQCGLKLVNHRSELEDHYKRNPPAPCRHDASQPSPLPCPACRRVWAGPAALAAHIRLSRGLCKETVQPLSVVPVKGRGVDCAFCPVCSRGMDPGETLADHLMTHLAPGLRCVQCGLVVGSHQEMQAHWAFLWRCDCSACDTHVGRGMRLLQHIIEDHDGGRRLTETARARPKRAREDSGVCPVCGKYSTRLTNHMKETHSTRFCSCCNKNVKLITYRNHQAKIRNIDKWRCRVCAKELSSGWALRTHMRLHTGEKPYECELCDAAYAQKVVLKTHMKTAHGIVWPVGPVAVTAPVAVTETEVTTAEVLFQ